MVTAYIVMASALSTVCFTGVVCETDGASNENEVAAVPATAETVSTTALIAAMPGASEHFTEELVVHAVVAQASPSPLRNPVGVMDFEQKFRPWIVTVLAPVSAALKGARAVITGASNVSDRRRVPTTALTVTTTYPLSRSVPVSAAMPHATVVADVHAVVLHTPSTASIADGVRATLPKLSPEIVTDEVPDGEAFGGAWKLATGASNVNGLTALVPTTAPIVIFHAFLLRVCAALSIYVTVVADDHDVVPHAIPSNAAYAVGVKLYEAKFSPVIEIIASPDSGPFHTAA